MSAPPDRHGRPAQAPTTPRPALHERTKSQNNTLAAIRIVPYTPPRLVSGERPPSQVSSHSRHASEGSTRNQNPYEDQESTSLAGPSRAKRADSKEGYATSRGPALSSDSVPSLRLARVRDTRVSGPKQAPDEGQGRTARPVPSTSPELPSPSDFGPADITSINASSSSLHLPHAHQQDDLPQLPHTPSSSAASSIAEADGAHRPLSRRRNFVKVHSDKTFSIAQLRPVSTYNSRSDVSGSLKSPPLSSFSYSSGASSSHEHPSISAWSDDHFGSPPLTGTSATIPDYSLSELPQFTPTPGSSTTQLAEDPITSSPWNYQLVGGLRKVHKTPELRDHKYHHITTESSPPPDTLPPLPEITVDPDEPTETPSKTLEPKASFASELTTSTTSENTNYKVYAHSPAAAQDQGSSDSLALVPTSSNNSNWELLGESSPLAPIESSPPGTSDSNENYIVHGEPSPSYSPLANRKKQPRLSYSQESLVVPPLSLRPSRKRSNEKFGYYKQRSRENLKAHVGSPKSVDTLSSIIPTGEVTQVFTANPVFTAPQGRPPSRTGEGETRRSRDLPSGAPSPWETNRQAGGSSTTGPSSQHPLPPVPMVDPHPHIWSSQLSTVPSESEGSTRGASLRSVSPSTGHGIPTHRRRSSAGWASSMHSRQLQSISSSLAAQLEEAASGSRGSTSMSDSIDRPRPAYSRAGLSGTRMIRDQDEHGDGIADLYDKSAGASRSGLSGFFSNSNSSSRNLHSSGSSGGSSINASSLPAWARLYYGSGERRYLRAVNSVSSLSDSGGPDSRPASSVFQDTGSPSTDHFPLAIFSPRKRAKEVHPPRSQRPFSDSASMDIAPAANGDYGIMRTLRHKTSSIWSPHLRTDRRATARYSIWEPPSVSWSADTGILGKRNAQVVMFALGFIFPFAWMIAALLPLPVNPTLDILEHNTASQTQYQAGHIKFAQRMLIVDKRRYESAQWWRNVNRIMSIIGLLIIGLIVALVVLGIKQGWVIGNR